MKKLIFTALLTVLSVITLSAQKSDASVSQLYQKYLSIKNALISDNANGASKYATVFLKSVESVNLKSIPKLLSANLKKNAKQITDAKNIDAQRSSFAKLSGDMSTLSTSYKLDDKAVYVMYCSMKKASWLSSEVEVRNPFFGNAMLNCGSIKSKINNL